MQLFWSIFSRDIKLALSRPSDVVWPVAFYLMVVMLFPLGISPDPEILAMLAAGIVWVGFLLSCLLSVEGLYRRDAENGTLEWVLLSPEPLTLMVLGRSLAHWLITVLPLVLLSPLLGIMLNLPPVGYKPLIFGLLIGTPVMVLIGGLGAAFTFQLRGGSVLLVLLVLPLYIPILLLGTGAVSAAIQGYAYTGHLLWMSVMAILAVIFVPVATASALRIGSGQ